MSGMRPQFRAPKLPNPPATTTRVSAEAYSLRLPRSIQLDLVDLAAVAIPLIRADAPFP